MNDNENEKKPEDNRAAVMRPAVEPVPEATAVAVTPKPANGEAAGANDANKSAAAADRKRIPETKPLRIYEYRFIRVRQNAWNSVEADVLFRGNAAVENEGGQLYGLWAGQIGLSANQGVIVTVWPNLDTARKSGKVATVGINGIVAAEAMYFEPTVRPLDPTPPEGPGIFAHRIFDVRKEDSDHFVQLSDDAWPQFEGVFGTRIFALWREIGHGRQTERLLLLTRYPDYAAWEKSRFWRPDPDPNAADAMQRLRKRREITVDTVVYTTRLAASAAN